MSVDHHSFLLALADAVRPLADPVEVQAVACRLLGEHLRASRVGYGEADPSGRLMRVDRDWTSPGTATAVGTYHMDDFVAVFVDPLREGAATMMTVAATDPRLSPPMAAWAAIGVRASIACPLVNGGRLVAALFVHLAAPRRWSEAEAELVRETGERVWWAVERAKAEAALAAEKEYAQSIVETFHEPLLVLHPDLTVKGGNTAFYTHFRVNPAETIGRKVYELGNRQWDIPALRTLLEDVLPDSHVFNDYQVTHEFEGLGRRVMLVNARRLDSVQLILLGIRDDTERTRAEDALRESEARQAFLLKLSDAVRPLADPVEVQAVACRLLGEHLGVDRAYYVEVDEPSQAARVRQCYTRSDSPPLVGEHRVTDFGWVIPPMRRGEMIVIPDATASPQVPAADLSAVAAVRTAAHVNAPLVKGGRLVGALCVTEPGPRGWTAAEVELVRETGERIWAAVERARVEAELAAELHAMTRLHELSDRLLTAPDLPTALGDVLDTAIALHGADKGTVQTYDPAADGLRYAAHRGFDPAALAAIPVVDRDFHSTCSAAIRTGKRVVATDIPSDRQFAEHAASAAELGYRAAVSTPLTTYKGEFRGVLTVHFREPHVPSERELRLADLYSMPAAHLIERARVEAELRASEGRLRAVADALPGAAAFVVGHDLRFRLAAGQALAAAGISPADYTGRRVDEPLPPETAVEHRANYQRALAGEPFRVEHAVGDRHFVTHGVPLRDEAGRVTAALAVSYDITDRVRAEEAARRSEEQLRLALAAARMGIWTLDADAGIQTRDANLNALLGLPAADTTQPFTQFFAHVHPHDRPAVVEAFARSARDQQPLNVEFRVVRPDGAVRWLRDQGDVFHTAGSRLLAGACVDITDLKEAEAAVRASEERLRLIVESATDYAIVTLAPDRTVTSWSPGAEATFGYTAGEMGGRSADLLFTPEDRAAGEPEREAGTARRTGRAANERWHLRKDGRRFFASGVLTPLGDPALGYVKVARDLTERKRVEEELEERVRERTAELAAAVDALEAEMGRRQALARRLATAQEDERRRVARDLHDTLGQLQAGLGLALAAARRTPLLPPAAGERLAEVQRLADELARETHALAVRLRPTVLDDLGLEPALAQLTSDWSARTRLPVDRQIAGLDAERLPAEVETTVYRLVQEALTNVARHAQAGRVGVSVTRSDGVVIATVEDDGQGFDPDAVPAGRLGLVGMRERVKLVGGTLEVEAAAGGGVTLIARLPLGGYPHG